MNNLKDWKLKLRYGKETTPFRHFTVIANGVVDELSEGFKCPKGKAFMGMKVWATDYEESADMIELIGKQIGFTISGKIEVFDTEPVNPPKEKPYGYDITFTPYE